VCALVVSITQTRIMLRQSELMDVQAHASVRPLLNVITSRAFNPDTRKLTEYRIEVVNSGVGPAVIDDVHVAYRSDPVGSWGDLIYRMEPPDSIPRYISNQQFNRSIIQAGEVVTILDLSDNLPLAQSIYRKFSAVDMTVLYSSIYRDQFQLVHTDDGWKNIPLDRRVESFDNGSFDN
jgi:hypothetical protein